MSPPRRRRSPRAASRRALRSILVGEDPASRVYVGAKGKAAKACGFHSLQYDLPKDVGEAELLALIGRLNADPAVHGILVQLPLPKTINSAAVLEAIAPHKDVDGFHPINVGLAAIGEFGRALIPCTPAGAMILIDRACAALGERLEGKEAVDRRPLQHRGQADGATAALAPLHGDDRPFAHPRPA